jgi:hypothetical protein
VAAHDDLDGTLTYCSGDGSGVTDLVSNATRLLPNALEDPRPWLSEVPSGNGRILTYLHELTHHWCFTSVLVNAQLHLISRAEVRGTVYTYLSGRVTGNGDSEDDIGLLGSIMQGIFGQPAPLDLRGAEQLRRQASGDIHDDVVRLEVVGSILRPLTEGLALFAEYDAVSRDDSDAWSPLPMAVLNGFLGREGLARLAPVLSPSTMAMAAAEVVGQARLSPEGLRGKASVLRGPLRSTGRGYLPGYLAVKSMWWHLCRVDPRLLSETDLALMYIRSFFFGDAVLAAKLLEPPRADCIASVNEIAKVFERRLAEFEMVTARDLREFEQHVSGDPLVEAHIPGLRRDPAETERGRQFIAQAVEEYRSGPLASVFAIGIEFLDDEIASLLNLRQYVTVCSVPVLARRTVDGGVDVYWRRERIWRIHAKDMIGFPDDVGEEFDATLDVLLGTLGQSRAARFVSLCRGGKAVACALIGPELDQFAGLRDEVAAATASRESRMEQARDLRFIAEKIVEDDIGLRHNRDHVRDGLDEMVDQIYRNTALWWCGDRDRCAELMAENGLRALLGSADAVKRAALLGLAASLDPRRESIRALFAERGHDLQQTLDELGACTDRYGFPPRTLELATDEAEPLLIPRF